MNPRVVKIALAASVALNLFAAVAGVSLWLGLTRAHDRIEAQHRPPRSGSPMVLIGALDPEVRDRARDTLRASALAARPAFQEAREKRHEAVALAASADFDRARIDQLLAQSREAELRGRAHLEADAVALLATLEPDDRKSLSQILTRRGRFVVRRRDDQRESGSHHGPEVTRPAPHHPAGSAPGDG